MFSRQSWLFALAILKSCASANPIDRSEWQDEFGHLQKRWEAEELRDWLAGIELDDTVYDMTLSKFHSTSASYSTSRYNLRNESMVCPQPLDDGDPSRAKEVWFKTAGSEIMQILFDKWGGEYEWTKNVNKLWSGNEVDTMACGDLDISNCGDFEEICRKNSSNSLLLVHSSVPQASLDAVQSLQGPIGVGLISITHVDHATVDYFPEMPSLWWIKTAATNAYIIIEKLYEAFQRNTLSAFLKLPELKEDFDLDDFGGEGVSTAVAGALTVAAGATSVRISHLWSTHSYVINTDTIGFDSTNFSHTNLDQFAWPLSGTISVINGFLSIFGQGDAPPTDPEALMQAQLSDAFDSINKQLFTLAKALLNGEGDLDILPYPHPCVSNLSDTEHVCVEGSEGSASPIANLFANGNFLYDDALAAIHPVVLQMHDGINQQLAVTAMRAVGYWIWLNPHISDAETCYHNWYGAQWVDGCCFMLYKPMESGNGFTIPAEPEMINRLQDIYHINMYDFYHNADRCQANHPNYDGYMDHTTLRWYIGQLPPCYYNVPVLYADEYVMCGGNLMESGHDYPDAINMDDFCWARNEPPDQPPPPKIPKD